ncbi:hypothetical protein N7925_10410 [Streptomyces sp. CA-278952]|uniref:hypothetical protein n=1 Tax=unclassified Streptomyces TaxID=2593676 RepID=UPI002241AD65|nr:MULTISPECIES: hypothetical protein [unclassified Streptomyces]UZI28778.1 hypothetical protein OH133_11910 [Streptomyces sp. VB1]WDG28727.1 hypothetical protein N7925_10410 [Streptomyces sp. CA-278952]
MITATEGRAYRTIVAHPRRAGPTRQLPADAPEHLPGLLDTLALLPDPRRGRARPSAALPPRAAIAVPGLPFPHADQALQIVRRHAPCAPGRSRWNASTPSPV